MQFEMDWHFLAVMTALSPLGFLVWAAFGAWPIGIIQVVVIVVASAFIARSMGKDRANFERSEAKAKSQMKS